MYKIFISPFQTLTYFRSRNFETACNWTKKIRALLFLIQKKRQLTYGFSKYSGRGKKTKKFSVFFCVLQSLSTQSNCQWKVTEEATWRRQHYLTNIQRNICFSLCYFVIVDMNPKSNLFILIEISSKYYEIFHLTWSHDDEIYLINHRISGVIHCLANGLESVQIHLL